MHRPLLKFLGSIVCWLCDLGGIWNKVYLSLETVFSITSRHPIVCTNLLRHYIQLIALFQSLYDKKGKFMISDKSTTKVNLKEPFLLLAGFPPKWIKTCGDMSYLLWFNFISLGYILAKLLSIRSQVNVLPQAARTTMHAIPHCTCLNRELGGTIGCWPNDLIWALQLCGLKVTFKFIYCDESPKLWYLNQYFLTTFA